MKHTFSRALSLALALCITLGAVSAALPARADEVQSAPVTAAEPTAEPTETPEETAEPEATPSASETPAPTAAPEASASPAPSETPSPSETPAPSASPKTQSTPLPNPVKLEYEVLTGIETDGELLFPVPYSTAVSQKYSTSHPAWDISAKEGADVVAADTGTVRSVQVWDGSTDDMMSYGNMVEIEHGEGRVTRYAHLSEINVQQGDTVERGQRIGRVGETGNADGAHLHFELILSTGERVDPALSFDYDALPHPSSVYSWSWVNQYLNNTDGTKTVSDFGAARESVVNELSAHEQDTFYLDTPYAAGDRQSPNGNISYNGYAGMNSAGFVGSVLYRSGLYTGVASLRTSSASPSDSVQALMLKDYDGTRGSCWFGSYGSRELMASAANYANWIVNGDLLSYAFQSKQEMLDSDVLEKGDLILILPLEGSPENRDAHLAVFWGNSPTEDKIWHSIEDTASDESGNRITSIPTQSAPEAFVVVKLDPKEEKAGLEKIDGVWRYYKNGEVDTSFTGVTKYNGGYFYVKNGVLDWSYTGLAKSDNVWRHFTNSKTDNFTGICRYNGGLFYVTNGILNWSYTGLGKFENTWYYMKNSRFDPSYSGVSRYNGGYFYVTNGKITWNYTGLCKYENVWRHFTNSKTDNFTGISKYNGGLYYVTNGILNWSYTGMAEYDGTWYYMSGSKLSTSYTGAVKHGSDYYFVQKGTGKPCAVGRTTDTVYLRSGAGTSYDAKRTVNDGTNITLLEKTNARWYRVRLSNGTEGYIYAEYIKVTGGNVKAITKAEIDTSKLTASEKKAKDVLDTIGWNLRAAYNWSAHTLPYYTLGPEVTGNSVHSEWYANFGFDNGKGNCYVMAATFQKMAKLLGYDVYFVEGYIRTYNGPGRHGWCEIVMDGTTYVFDPNFEYGGYGNGYKITYGASGTFQYIDYKRVP